MAHQNDPEPLLPKGFAHLEGDLRTAQIKLEEIDTLMANIPHDNGPTPQYNHPEFNPPGTTRVAADRTGMIKQLEDRKAVIREDFNEKLEKNLVNADPKTANNVRDAVKINLSDSELRKMDREQVKAYGKEPKSIDKSEDFLNKTLANYRATNIDKEPAPEISKTTHHQNRSASDRFMMSLNYTKELAKVEAIPDPEKEPPEKSNLPEITGPDVDIDRD